METKKTADVYSNPIYKCLLKSTLKARKINEEQRKELQKKNQTIHQITHRNGRFLDMITNNDYVEQNIKLENKVKDQNAQIDDLEKQKAELECQRNDFEYKYKMMEFYDNGFGETKSRYHDMTNKEVQTEDIKRQSNEGYAEDNNGAEPAECKQQ